jgi:hypothetical protein
LPALQQLAQSAVEILGERIPQLVNIALESMMPELETELGIGLITD